MRTPIELALSIRSWERIVCLTDPAAPRRHPEHWLLPQTLRNSTIDPETVVIVDRIELSPKALAAVCSRCPRLVAFALASIEHEKATRRLVKESYPFADAWDFSTDFAKLLVTDAKGRPYERDRVLDMRPEARA